MAALPQALDTALRAYYKLPDMKRAVTHRQGLTARMNALERLHAGRKGDRTSAATRAAAAAGIPVRTWRDWKSGKSKGPISPRNQRKLEGAYVRQVQLPAFQRVLRSKHFPKRIAVTAEVNWSGYYNRTRRRTITLQDKAETKANPGRRPYMPDVVRVWIQAGPDAAAQTFQERVAADNSAGFVAFEGDVEIEFLEGK